MESAEMGDPGLWTRQIRNVARKNLMDRDDIPELTTIWDEAREYIESGNYDNWDSPYQLVVS